MNRTYHPLRSLQAGHWFKLICGASFQHLPIVRNLALACTLAGVDCIDVSADSAVVLAAWEGIQAAQSFLEQARDRGIQTHGSPWVMVSLNDGEDPHFRKAQFDAATCPPDCPRPCEAICPTQAIVASQSSSYAYHSRATLTEGVIASRCYGCGRCVTQCPYERISTYSYVTSPSAIAPLVLEGVDALEIHTQPGRFVEFCRLWQAILPWVGHLKVIAISCPDGDGVVDYLRSLYAVMAPLPCPLIWQTDGRPMSGDIGNGTTHAAIQLGQRVLAAKLPGYVQLAGGTNGYTVKKLRELGLLPDITKSQPSAATPSALQNTHPISSPAHIAGIAYGSYLRSLLAPIFDKLDAIGIVQVNHYPLSSNAYVDTPIHLSKPASTHLEAYPELLWEAVRIAHSLVKQLKHQSPVVSS
ncbi:MAG: 4Fe-4S ferredoxin [Cyanobacteria bacterium]|nr:4Fe-4S ferredoxin [Cyanobacteriota bacterium]MDW8201680.1 LdpA C-terminal domain-containing domain [Cyanobacteriota bacterium SKYGB_h_bin112]